MAAPIKKKIPASPENIGHPSKLSIQLMEQLSKPWNFVVHTCVICDLCYVCLYLTKRTNKTPLSASHQLQQAQRIPQAPALVAGPVNWDLLSTQLELAHQCHVCCDGSHPRRTRARKMPRPSECFRIHWKSVDTTCNCKQPSARRPLLSSWWPSWYYKFLLYLFVIKM